MNDEETVQSVTWALEAGVRHVDSATCASCPVPAWRASSPPPCCHDPTAKSHPSFASPAATGYENEDACKKAIEGFCATSGVDRADIFYTTKLRAPTTYDDAVAAVRYSVKHAPGGYVDLYLMHSAIGGPELREESWRAFEWAKKEGLVRSIGVSNCRSPFPCLVRASAPFVMRPPLNRLLLPRALQGGVKHIEEHVQRVADPSKPEIVTLPSLNQVRAPRRPSRACGGPSG